MYRSNLLLILLLFLALSCNSNEKEKLRIAAASNMQFAIKEVAKAFQKEYDLSCETIISSSGKLTAQIKEGAPYDLFISADMKYPNLLVKEGFCVDDTRVYAYGQLVLWSPSSPTLLNLDSLSSSSIKHIALANPKTAPYGRAAKEALDYFGLSQSIEDKLVFGESISQTNQFILSGAAETGFTAKSVVLSPNLNTEGQWLEIDPSAYQAIEQGIVVLKDSRQLKNALLFRDFLQGSKGKKILEDFGYKFREQ